MLRGKKIYRRSSGWAGMLAMDRDIVRLLNKIDELGLRDNTVVICMGDNGMQWRTHDCHGIREPYEDSARWRLSIEM